MTPHREVVHTVTAVFSTTDVAMCCHSMQRSQQNRSCYGVKISCESIKSRSVMLNKSIITALVVVSWSWGTAAAVPPPFRPSDPALCGSCPLVTPYYCRLGDLLCCMCVYLFVSIIVYACVFCVVSIV